MRKQKKLDQKLVLNQMTIASLDALDEAEKSRLKGGNMPASDYQPCWTQMSCM